MSVKATSNKFKKYHSTTICDKMKQQALEMRRCLEQKLTVGLDLGSNKFGVMKCMMVGYGVAQHVI